MDGRAVAAVRLLHPTSGECLEIFAAPAAVPVFFVGFCVDCGGVPGAAVNARTKYGFTCNVSCVQTRLHTPLKGVYSASLASRSRAPAHARRRPGSWLLGCPRPPCAVRGNNNQESQELAPLRCSNKARNTLPLITRHAGADRGLGTGPPPVVRRGAPSEDARGRGPTRGLLRLDVARLALVVLLGEHGHDHLPAVDLCRRVDDADARVDEVRLRSGSRLT